MMRLADGFVLDGEMMSFLPTLRKVKALIFRTSHDAPHVWDGPGHPSWEYFSGIAEGQRFGFCGRP
jgi:hypothetical protein